MTRMFFALLVFVMLSSFSCKTQQSKQSASNDVAEKTVATGNGLEGRWLLVRSKDNYDNIWKDASESRQTIEFFPDGKYVEKDKSNGPCNGTYRKEAENALAITHSCNTAELRYGIDDVSAEKLVLSIRGRHGAVLYEYERAR